MFMGERFLASGTLNPKSSEFRGVNFLRLDCWGGGGGGGGGANDLVRSQGSGHLGLRV